MNGSRIALDTSEAIAILNKRDVADRWFEEFPVVCLPIPVVGELRFGALNSRHASDNVRRIEALVSRCRVLAATLTTAETYAAIRLRLKRAGNPIPENDVWIAAQCVEHALPLATADEHFTHVEGLEILRR